MASQQYTDEPNTPPQDGDTGSVAGDDMPAVKTVEEFSDNPHGEGERILKRLSQLPTPEGVGLPVGLPSVALPSESPTPLAF